MARVSGLVLISVAVCFALLLVALMPQTAIEQPTGYFSMQVKENPGMTISKHYFSLEEQELVNETIHGGLNG